MKHDGRESVRKYDAFYQKYQVQELFKTDESGNFLPKGKKQYLITLSNIT